MSTIATPRSSAGIARWATLGGVAYVILFAVGVVLTFSGVPDSSSAPAKVIAYYSTPGTATGSTSAGSSRHSGCSSSSGS